MHGDNEFRPAAFWFWHYLPDEQECQDVLESAARAGLGCLLVQARLSMPLGDYLSSDYLARCAFVGRQAQALGLSIEIYDEYNWMSGHGGGTTVAGADHLRERHLFWCKGRAAPKGEAHVFTISSIHSSFLDFLGPEGALWCQEEGHARWGEWQVEGFVRNGEVLSPRDLIVEPGEAGCTVTAWFGEEAQDRNPSDPKRHAATVSGESITLLVSARSLQSRLVNYLLPEMAERFADKVYGPLLETLPTAEGFFFDHPYAGFQDWTERCGFVGNSILWDESLLTRGLSLRHLAALAEEEDEDSSRLRLEFFRLYSSRMHEAFFGTLSRWCREHGVGLSGHELLPHVGAWSPRKGLGGMDPRVMPGTDHFGVDRYRKSTTVDAADYVPQLSVILGDSVARANGRSRCTVEQYSTGREAGRASLLGQWDLTPARLRTQSLRHLLCGARRILLHALYLPGVVNRTPAGMFDPRQDFPPGFNLQPWWEHMALLSNELLQVSKFLEDGVPVRTVALLYPLADLWAGPVDAASARIFGAWAQALDEAGCPFVIIDESQLQQGQIEAGITTVILPGAGWLEHAASFTTLSAFGARRGCEILTSTIKERPLVPLCGQETPDNIEFSTNRTALENMLRGVSEETIGAEAWRLAATLRNVACLSPPDQPENIAVHAKQKPPLGGRITWHRLSDTADGGARARLAVQNETGRWRDLVLGVSENPRHLKAWEPVPAEAGREDGPLNWTGRSWGTLAAGETAAIRMRPHEMLCLEWQESAPADNDPATGKLDGVQEWMPFPNAPTVSLSEGWQFTEDPRNGWQPVQTGMSLEEQGMGTEGQGTYRLDLGTIDRTKTTCSILPQPGETGACDRPSDLHYRWYLVIPDVRGALACHLNDLPCGISLTDQTAFALPAGVTLPAGLLELVWRGTAAGRFYKDHPVVEGERREKSGLLSAPRLELWRSGPRLRRLENC
ncbi:hypothetical protein [Acetobacter conturbans]|uniref:Carbohydrate-binding protein n=1 Tax=Acetobacter conturbans TaxID=1737472 RepID=A0ABX0JWM8_9PROT|nr:hypothetical protein [Acetobacter conturbans]NHN87178.1 hypothetical protein [Acetobacter conturbans]